MALNDKDSLLTIGDKKYNVSELIKHLVSVPGDYFVGLLKEVGLTIPRKLRMGVLKNVLNAPALQTIEERKTLADEMGYRLTWFSRYTDTQLVNLLEWYSDLDLSQRYLEQLWVQLLKYFENKGVDNQTLEKLFNYALNLKNAALVSSKDFNKVLNEVLYDDEGEIDGVTPENFRPVLYKSSTLTELREIGRKYNAPVPQRLKKKELLNIIFAKLEEREELTEDLKVSLPKQNIILLERYAKDHKILVSTDLKKEEIIEYILSNAKETKEKYYVPQSQDVYHKEVEEVEETTPTLVEEVKEEVKEVVEEKVVHTTTVVQAETIDYRPAIENLTKSFESLAQALANKDFVINVNSNPQINVAQVKDYEPVEEKPQHLTFEDEAGFGLNKEIVAALFSESEPVYVKEEVVESVEVEDVVENLREEPTKVKRPMSKFLLKTTSTMALVGVVVWVIVAITAYFDPNKLISILPSNLPFDLATISPYYIIGGASVLALYALVVALRMLSKRVSRIEVFIHGIVSFIVLPLITLFALITSVSVARNKEKVVKVVKDGEVKVAKPKYPMSNALLNLAAILAFVSMLVWLGVVVISSPWFYKIDLVAPYIPFYDITTLRIRYLMGGGLVLALLNFIALVRIKDTKVSRFEVFVFGVLLLPVGFAVTGLVALLASFSHSKEKTAKLKVDKPKREKVLKPKYNMSKPLLVLASIAAFVSALAWIGVLALAIPAVNKLGLIAPYIPFYDITTLDTTYVLIGSGVLALFNLIFSIRFNTRGVSRTEVFILSILTLPAGFVVTGVLGLLAVFSRGKKVEKLDKKESSEIAIAISEIASNMKYLNKDKQSTGKKFFVMIFVLIFIAFLAFAGLYLVWRLPQTQDYVNNEILNYGQFLEKFIKSIFGSAHH